MVNNQVYKKNINVMANVDTICRVIIALDKKFLHLMSTYAVVV